jgi:transcription elongation factor Elf1
MKEFSMPSANDHVVKFQCPNCGHDLEQSIGQLKLGEHMQCAGCGIGINIDTNRLADAADQIRRSIEKVPPEITIKFFR